VIKKNNPAKLAEQLLACRKKIDAADRALLAALSARFKAVEKVGKLKHAHGLPLYQKARWQEVVENRVQIAHQVKVDEQFTRKFLRLIHQEAIRIQTELAPSRKSNRGQK
jgi:chorismate mutase